MIVDRCRRHEEDSCSHDESREGAVSVRVRIAESVGFVNDEEAGRTARRPDGPYAERFMGDDGHFMLSKTIQQIAPLGYENRGHNETERLLPSERHGKRHVRFPEPYRI